MVAHAWNVPQRKLVVKGLGADGTLSIEKLLTKREAVESIERGVIVEDIIGLAERITFFNSFSHTEADYREIRKQMLSLGRLEDRERVRLENEFHILAIRDVQVTQL